jgi:hypothetical protein
MVGCNRTGRRGHHGICIAQDVLDPAGLMIATLARISGAGLTLVSTDPGPQKMFVFPTNLPSCATSGRHMLIATEGFAALGLVSPDYLIPNGFLQIPTAPSTSLV